MVESIEELSPKLDSCPLGDPGRLEERHEALRRDLYPIVAGRALRRVVAASAIGKSRRADSGALVNERHVRE
jgi:hypothetical protein